MSNVAEKRFPQFASSDAILNALPNPVMLIAPDGKIVDANIAAEILLRNIDSTSAAADAARTRPLR